jgi:hypothetical protein
VASLADRLQNGKSLKHRLSNRSGQQGQEQGFLDIFLCFLKLNTTIKKYPKIHLDLAARGPGAYLALAVLRRQGQGLGLGSGLARAGVRWIAGLFYIVSLWDSWVFRAIAFFMRYSHKISLCNISLR